MEFGSCKAGVVISEAGHRKNAWIFRCWNDLKTTQLQTKCFGQPVELRQIHFKSNLKFLFTLFLLSAAQHFMCCNSFHVVEVILINLHTQPLIEGHKGQNLFDVTLTYTWKVHSSIVIVPPDLCEFPQLPEKSGSLWVVWAAFLVLGIALPQLTEEWESSMQGKLSANWIDQPILLKPHFHNLSPRNISNVWFVFLSGLLYLVFFKHWTFSTSFYLSALMQVVQTISVSQLLIYSPL